uniref:Secreted protein n=1 Tax=Rhizophora mucronata TaxID=61149 RepID=A0A2P2MGZ8_RHIMU
MGFGRGGRGRIRSRKLTCLLALAAADTPAREAAVARRVVRGSAKSVKMTRYRKLQMMVAASVGSRTHLPRGFRVNGMSMRMTLLYGGGKGRSIFLY